MANTLNLGNGNWATKKDSLLAYNSENGNFKPLPFDFTRASSATVVNKAGLIETVGSGEPRIDFKDDAKGALLLEPQRTNLVPNSENMSTWNQTSLLSVTGGNVGVYGSVNAYNVIPNATSTSHRIWISSLGLSSNNHTFTIYAKENGCKDLFVYCNSSGTDYASWFNLETGLKGSASGGPTSTSMTPVGNGWHKIQISGNTDLFSIEVYLGNGTESISWLPDGTQGALMQFGQLEQGSYATSYIPTQGSAVTRVAESSSQTVPSGIIGQAEGVLYVEFKFKGLPNSASSMPISIDGSGSNEAYIYIDVNNIVYGQFIVGGSFTCNISGDALIVGNTYKIAFAYKNSSFALFVNGVLSASLNSGAVGANQNIRIGNYLNGNYPHDNINQAKIYNTRLSNAELAALTT